MSAILDWIENHSTLLSLIVVVVYLISRLTGYYTPRDYKLNYIESHTNEATTQTYLFIRSITALLAVIFLGLLIFKMYK
jgi:hypothetical protein